MPCNVTMQQPVPRIIGLERQDQESVIGQENDISSWRVVQFEIDRSRVEWSRRLLKNGEVVPVEVNLE